MYTNDLIRNFEKRAKKSDLKYLVGEPASTREIEKAQERLGVRFPSQLKQFYQTINGLHVNNPLLDILCLNDLEIDKSGRIHFATFDKNHRIGFNTAELNAAEQWDIINMETEFKLTLTVASFWSNKIWGWIDRRRPVWQDENYY